MGLMMSLNLMRKSLTDVLMPRKYVLRCVECQKRLKDEYTNICPESCFSLLRTEYRTKTLELRELPGMFRFYNWLPVEDVSPVKMLAGEGSAPISYKSEELAKELRLRNLYISFSGYWPERNAFVKSCTFKEFEAPPTFLRAAERARGKVLVVASAGNTARAFSQISSTSGFPLVAVVPKDCLHRMWTTEPANNVFLIAVKGDYTDAIKVGEKIASLEGMLAEGGTRNVARRDGLGVVLLDAVFTMGELPDHYFQAVGSGTGAIGVFEAALRLISDGRFGARLPRLHLSQNLPFAPMFRAWRRGSREIAEEDMPNAEDSIKRMYADVLSNKNPPYSVRGGVYDVLSSTSGLMYGVTNRECIEAEKLFEGTEGIDLDPAAAVCVASLFQAVERGLVKEEDKILLNVTGGGYKRLKEDFDLCELEVWLEVGLDTPIHDIEKELREFIKSIEP